MKPLKVVVWGLGAMGSGIARSILAKKGVEIVGVCDTHPERKGRDLYEVLRVPPPAGRGALTISGDISGALRPGECDVCVVATASFVPQVFDQLVHVLNSGANALTIAEEMAFPRAGHPQLADELDRVAKACGVTVLGTGINPGLVMDLLALCLSAAMTDLESVHCRRVNSLSPFGRAVMEEQGIGLSPEEFNAKSASGAMAGHVGFAESVGLMAAALGWPVTDFQQQMKPILTEVERVAPYGRAAPGQVAGVEMTAQGLCQGRLVFDLVHPQQIEPEAAGVKTGDYIILRGTPEIHMRIEPEINGGLGTIAMCVNCLPLIVNAPAGLKTMIDLPIPRAVMGDFRDHIEPDRKIVK